MILHKYGAVAYAREEGEEGVIPLLIDNWKRNENHFLERSAFFHTEIAEIAIMFFVLSNFLIILRNFHCDALLPVVKFFWCVALELMSNSKCTPGQSQWALLKLESCCDVMKRVF